MVSVDHGVSETVFQHFCVDIEEVPKSLAYAFFSTTYLAEDLYSLQDYYSTGGPNPEPRN